MLIPSPRHRPEDLALWQDLEEIDKIWYATHNMRSMEDRAIEEIAKFASQDHCYLGVSWGKDSVVAAHLAMRADVTIPLVWIRVEPIKNPECELVRDVFLRAWPNADYHEIVIWCRHDSGGWHASGTLEDGAKQAASRWSERYISGIVKYESGQRMLSRAVHGVTTDRCCRPIIDWKTASIYAYLHHYDLPIHPAYAMVGNGRWDRERIRVASLGGRRGDGMGRTEWEREYYGDVLNRLHAPARSV